MIDIIGYVAMLGTVISFWFNKQSMIRLINTMASIIWIWYSVLVHNMPSLLVNIFIIAMHLIWFIKYKFNAKK